MSSPLESPSDDLKGVRWPVFLVVNSDPSSASSALRKPFSKRDPSQVERTNLVNLCKLIVKELIDSSVKYGRMLDSDFMPLQHFFIVLEHALRHGLRPKKGILGPKKELWDLLQIVEKSANEACDITASVRDLPTVKTSLGRARAWIRLALMQKKLSDYLKILIDQKDNVLHEFYEPGALLLSDEAVILLGLLLGLNIVDCNLCLKEEDLDSQQGVIDFSLYLRSGSSNAEIVVTDTVESSNMTAVLDQKNYVEELNRHLSATMTNLQSRLDATTTNNTLIKEELVLTKTALTKAQDEVAMLRGVSQRGEMNSQEMEPIKRNSNYSEDAIAEVKLQLAEEKNRRLDLERDLELQSSMRAETEVALKLLEKDIHEKQDTIVSLRKQLEDIKLINLEMFRKMQDLEKTSDAKSKHNLKLEKEMAENQKSIASFKEQIEELQLASKRTDDNTRRSMEENMELESKCRTLEEDIRLEREWRQSLQDSIVKERTILAELKQQMEESQEIGNLNEMEYSDLKEKHLRLLKVCTEQEKALEEVGVRLRDTKLEADHLKEAATVWVTKDAHWAPDDQVTHCRLCDKEFNLSRRKHHCRNCGEIFCASCSDNTMPLPSSAKPVRVCDTCHTRLLQRYSALQ